ncbi:MAG: hypothetical protein WCP92_08950 [bacterium]
MISKVAWIDSKTTTFLNTKEAISNQDVYDENTKNENLTVNLPRDIQGTKKTIAQESISKIK